MNTKHHALISFDNDHLWHPYTSMTQAPLCHLVKQAQGVLLELSNGEKLIDGMASWWAAIHGYNVPELNLALTAQMQQMSHVMFGGLTHEPAILLGQNLLSIVPAGLQHIFFADSGSVSVEVALKMALQYQRGQGQIKRTRIASFYGGYHGDTLGAMSVCDPHTGMHRMFQGLLAEQVFLPKPECRFSAPWHDSYFEITRDVLVARHDEIAAVIVEPIVQGAGGMFFYHPRYLKLLRQLCTELDILLIADEIATGFGRTGQLFACEWAEISPDIFCIGKALTGGYMTLAATLCTEDVTRGLEQSESGVLMHGPTFMANPLACAVASASIQKLLDSDWHMQVKNIEQHLSRLLQPFVRYKCVQDVRCLGAIGVVELDREVDLSAAQRIFVENGVWLRPFGRLIYLMPPYCITSHELEQLSHAIECLLRHLS